MPVNPFFAAERIDCYLELLSPEGVRFSLSDARLPPGVTAGLAPVKRTYESYRVRRGLSTAASSSGCDLHQMILLRAFAKHEQSSFDRVG